MRPNNLYFNFPVFSAIKSTIESEEPEEEPDQQPEEPSVYDEPCKNSKEIYDINQNAKNIHQKTNLNSSSHDLIQKKYKEDNFHKDKFKFNKNIINKESNKFQINENNDTNITTSSEVSNKLFGKSNLFQEKLLNKNNDKLNNSQSDTNNCNNKNNNINSSFSLSDSSFNNKNSNLSFNSTKNTISNIKKNLINKKIKISLKKPNEFFKNNNRYLFEEDNVLTPIDEKLKGFNFYSIVSQKYSENQMKLDDEKDELNDNQIDTIFRKSLEPKYDKNFFVNSRNSKKFLRKKNIKSNLINNDIFSDCISDKKDNKKYESDSCSNDNLYYNNKKNSTTFQQFDLNEEENEHSNFYSNTKSSMSCRNIQKISKLNRILKNTNIDLDEFKQDEISINDLKNYFRIIQSKSKNITNSKNYYIKTLIEIQNFYIDEKSTAIWVFKISKDFKYIAFGFKDGLIKIYSIMGNNFDEYENIYNKKNIANYFKFIYETPYAILHHHSADIIDLSWSPFNSKLLLSASLDHNVILWKILEKTTNECNNYLILNKYKHNDIVTSISFNPANPYIFVSGCFDRFIRVYKIKNEFLNQTEKNISYNDKNNLTNDVLEYFNIQEIITSVEFFPDGKKLAVGTHNGKIYIYTIFPNIYYNFSFFCRNRLGKFSNGRKVTSIEFIDRSNAIITTSDSRIRCVSMLDGTMKIKYKGHLNNNSMIRSSVDFCGDMIISGSEDGFCYIWSLVNKENLKIKNYHYEYFKPFSNDIINCSQIAPEFCMVNYCKKIYKITNKINIISVIINCTDKGRCEVILNVE